MEFEFDRMERFEKAFWAMFVLIEIGVIFATLQSFHPAFPIIGVAMIAIAVLRIEEYKFNEDIRMRVDHHSSVHDRLTKWLNNEYDLIKEVRSTNERRMHTLDKKKVELDEKMEKMYRELAGKIIDVENKMNIISKGTHVHLHTAAPAKAMKGSGDITFFEVWESVKKIFRERGHVRTLSRRVKNNIKTIDDKKIVLVSEMTKKTRTITRDELEEFWNLLHAKKKLNFHKDLKDPKLIRIGSIVIALLAALPYIEFTLKPRVLHLKDHVGHKI